MNLPVIGVGEVPPLSVLRDDLLRGVRLKDLEVDRDLVLDLEEESRRRDRRP
jgi:hypothetical protein